MRWTFVRDVDRYGELRSIKFLPREFVVEGLTADQAEELADWIGANEAGCTGCIYVKELNP